MKKKTNLQTAPEEGEAKPRQRGPQKEKTQVTIRVDQELMNAAYAQMKEDNTRITDIIERGIIMVLEEARHELPVWNTQVRFMVANATREQQELLRGLLIAMVLGEVREALKKPPLTPEAEKHFENTKWFLSLCNKTEDALACLQWYSRYGKSAQEIAELEKRVRRSRHGKSAGEIAKPGSR